MSRRTSCTFPARTRTLRPPSPSTRARAPTVIVRTLLMELALLPERLGARVERAEGAHEAGRRDAELGPERRERGRVRRLHRTEAAEASAGEGGAESVAARLRHRAQAGHTPRDHDARSAAPLALEAHAGSRRHRLATREKGAHDLEELRLARPGSRAARSPRTRDRGSAWTCRGPRGTAATRRRLSRSRQRPCCCGAPGCRRRSRGADRDEEARRAADLVDPLGVVRRRDRALDEDEVVGALSDGREASRKLTMRRLPRRRGSSSQSRRESWQPSQEAA